MAIKTDFSTEDWELVMDIPILVGMSVMLAGKSGMGTMKESFAMSKEIFDKAKSGTDNQLIEAVVNARLKDKERSSMESIKNNPYAGEGREAVLEAAVEKATKLCAVLDAHCSEQEAEGFKQWAMDIAEKVAMAASEGGFLGFGGTQLSAEEKTAIARIEDALGVSATA